MSDMHRMRQMHRDAGTVPCSRHLPPMQMRKQRRRTLLPRLRQTSSDASWPLFANGSPRRRKMLEKGISMCFRPAAIEMDKTCPQCGAKCGATSTTCPQCGAELPAAPAMPGIPGAPGAPGMPAAPGAPGAPSRPGAPAAPGAPSTPGA